MTQVKLFAAKNFKALEEGMNKWLQDEEAAHGLHILSLVPLPAQEALVFLMIYETDV